jgi:hypothetical protein
MGMIAETEIVDYHNICRPRKANFRLPFPFSANKGKFAISALRL